MHRPSFTEIMGGFSQNRDIPFAAVASYATAGTHDQWYRNASNVKCWCKSENDVAGRAFGIDQVITIGSGCAVAFGLGMGVNLSLREMYHFGANAFIRASAAGLECVPFVGTVTSIDNSLVERDCLIRSLLPPDSHSTSANGVRCSVRAAARPVRAWTGSPVSVVFGMLVANLAGASVNMNLGRFDLDAVRWVRPDAIDSAVQ